MDDNPLHELEKDLYRRSDRAWVLREATFPENFQVTEKQMLFGGSTCSNPIVENAIVARARSYTRLPVTSVIDLGNQLHAGLPENAQAFFKNHILKGQSFSNWLMRSVPVEDTRLPGGKECVYTIADVKNCPLFVRDGHDYRVNPVVEAAFLMVLKLEIDLLDRDTDTARVLFTLTHDDPEDIERENR